MSLFAKKLGVPDSKDWGVTAADKIEGVIDSVRDKAVVPLTTAARAIVYGLLAAIVGLVALVLVIAGLIRLLNVYLSNIPGVSDGIWVTYLVLGTVFVLAGLFVWSKRTAKATNHGA